MAKVFAGMRMDPDVLRLVDVIAAQETKGNRSAAVRKVVREAAQARGLRAVTIPATVVIESVGPAREVVG